MFSTTRQSIPDVHVVRLVVRLGDAVLAAKLSRRLCCYIDTDQVAFSRILLHSLLTIPLGLRYRNRFQKDHQR